jgi:hypothetical protein
MISDTLIMDFTLVLGTIVVIIAIQWAALPRPQRKSF